MPVVKSKLVAASMEIVTDPRAPAFVLRLAMGEMADALLLTGQRVVPERALEMGFTFEYQTLEPAVRAIFGRR